MLHFGRRGESLVGIIVGVFIIAIVIWGIAKILSVQYAIEDDYFRSQTLFILKNNATNIVRKVDTSSVSENEIFSLYKDTTNRRYLVMTGANIETYKYIDRRGNWVSNTGSFQDVVYTRLMFLSKNITSPVQKQVVKGEIRELIRK